MDVVGDVDFNRGLLSFEFSQTVGKEQFLNFFAPTSFFEVVLRYSELWTRDVNERRSKSVLTYVGGQRRGRG